MNGNLTLARVFGPDPEPEFRYCVRCDNSMGSKRVSTECEDCENAQGYRPRGVQGQYLQPFHPAYEVSVHFDKHPKHDPTLATLDALEVPYIVYTAKRDEIEVEWAKNLLNPELPIQWPIVLISAHGKALEHWTGFDLAALNRIPAARAAAISPTQTKAAQRGVPIKQEEAA